MTDTTLATDYGAQSLPTRWSAGTWASIISMSAATFALVSAEFLPAGLLTPMAADLGISEGTAGQVVTVTATVGAVAALFANVVIGRLNRKVVLLGLSALAVISNLLAAFATDFWVLLLGRAGLGIGLSGFWSLSAAVVARLVGVQALGRGMAIRRCIPRDHRRAGSRRPDQSLDWLARSDGGDFRGRRGRTSASTGQPTQPTRRQEQQSH